ncbi:phage tail tape measure protein [Arcobacter arenosus]|uniref:Phage tail tape measure protein n=1 Tax=Arcobacter arenosus TaxID=2576037 RepID=A0A5R8Y4M8_9BACT|nr:hypothetical protein [Arcobacter arenosus]TLP41035.1 hypothetical protein FDK22_03175 [Arcobacter arenosus]
MAQTIGSVLIDVKADTQKLIQGFEKAEKKVESATKLMKNAIVGLASAASVGVFANMVKSSVDLADATGEAAEKIGVTTEYLSKMRYAAEFSGVSVGQLDAAISAMIRRTNNFKRDGGGAAANALNELGISADFARKNFTDVETTFNIIADRLSKLPDGLEKTAIAQDIFSKSASDVVRLANQGAEGIAELGRQAEITGNVISTEFAENAGALNDSLDTLSKAFTGIGNKLAVELAPSILTATRAFEGLLGIQRELSEYEINQEIKKTTEEIQKLGSEWNSMNDDLNEGYKNIFSLFKSETMLENGMDSHIQKIEKLSSKLTELQSKLYKETKTKEESGIQGQKTLREIQLEREIKALKDRLALLNKSNNPVIDKDLGYEFYQAEAQFEALDELYEKKDQLVKSFADKYKRSTMDKYDYEREMLLKEVQELETTEADKLQIREYYDSELQKINDRQVKEFENLQDESKPIWEQMGEDFDSGFGNAFANTLLNGENAFDGFLKSLASKFISSQVNKMFDGVGSSLFGGVGSFISTLFNANGNAFINGQVQAFATGGVVNSPTLFSHSGGLGVAGEAGSELIAPMRMGNGEMGVQSKPSKVTLNITNNTSSEITAEQVSELTKTNQNGEQERVITLVLDAISRNKNGSRDALRSLV